MGKYGIDRKEVADVDGEKYYLRIRGKDIKNPVVLFLHGGCRQMAQTAIWQR